MTSKIMTANRLRDGLVVYLDEYEAWSQSLATSKASDDDAGYQALVATAEAAVANREVIEPYLIDVEVDDDGIRPTRLRDSIRASGPTVAAGATPAVAAE